MDQFYIKLTPTLIPFVNKFRETFNVRFKRPIDRSYNYIEYQEFKGHLELTGSQSNPLLDLISKEEFIRFYNEKMGINQSTTYELW